MKVTILGVTIVVEKELGVIVAKCGHNFVVKNMEHVCVLNFRRR